MNLRNSTYVLYLSLASHLISLLYVFLTLYRVIDFREILTDALRVIVNNPFKEVFMGKEKKILIF